MRSVTRWQGIAVGALASLLGCGTSGSGSLFSIGSGSTGASSTGSGAGGSIVPSGGSGGGAIGGSTGSGGTGPGGPVNGVYPCPGCPPFPGGSAPPCSPNALAAPSIAYPPDGVLLPPNMNVLEVQFVPNSTASLFEIDFSNGVTSVKVIDHCNPVPDVRRGPGLGCGVTLPQAAWNDIANVNRDGDPVHVSVRATDGTCVSTSTDKVDVSFAKTDLAGGIYYWQSATFGGIGGTTGGIYTHDFGTFDPTPVPFYTSGASGTCVGCHHVSRDGVRISLGTDDPDADDEMGDVDTQLMDTATRSVLLGGSTLSAGFQTFTHDHRWMVASTFTSDNTSFAAFDGNGSGTAAVVSMLAGGARATHPDLSADDRTLLFVVPKAGTIAPEGDHHFMGGSLYTAPFDAAAGTVGSMTLLLAASGAQNFYYPSFAAPGTFIVLNEAPNDDAFYNRMARVKLLHYPPIPGAPPLDLPALNTPARGTGDPARLSNSWPKWSPFVQSYKGHKLLWVTFSSNRDYGLHLKNQGFDNCYPPKGPAYNQPQPLSKKGVTYESCGQPQIWMAAIVIDEDPSLDATDRSFAAFWLPFQDVNAHNHTAQWVQKVVGQPPSGDGGGCGQDNAPCGPGATCCSESVCCGTVCLPFCVK